jgi:hypothetical protein
MIWPWLLRFAKLLSAGLLVAICVTELELAFGVDLLDVPFFQMPAQAIWLGLTALAFAAYQTRPAATARGVAMALLVFAVVVLPYNGFVERPALPVEFWRGTTALFLDRVMTVNRPHSVVLVSKAAQPVGQASQGQPQDRFTGATIVARLAGEPDSSFSIAPSGDQARALAGTEDVRWAWTATPRREGAQRIVLELDTMQKHPGASETPSNVLRQLVVVRVQAPSWYEQGRERLLHLMWGP